jgi:glycerol-3-phosphate acyltransferase PlsX
VGSAELAVKAAALDARLIPTNSFLSQSDSLNTALRHRPQSSMRLALTELAQGRVDAVVSAGNTAALMALSRQLLPRAPGLQRPAICKMLAGKYRPVWLLDLGANIDCSAEQLQQFATMGAALASGLLDRRRPSVGLLNIGAEVTKGPAVLGQAAQLLGRATEFEYSGFVEAHEIFDGRVDVVVSDGLLGNVALKAIEGAASMAQHMLLEHISTQSSRGFMRRALVSRLLGWLLASRDLADVYDPQGYNGASLLGLAGVVVKSHGRADGHGYVAAVRQASSEYRAKIPQRVFDLFRSEVSDQS